ncbi:hypothetical protein [Methylobacterium sp. Gmos1]
MWRLGTKNLPAGVSHLIVDDHGVIALVKKRGRAVKAGPLLAAAPDLLQALIDARSQLECYESERTGEAFNDTRINAAIDKARAQS